MMRRKPRKTKIQWTDYTINFWIGCRKVSPGCKYCYMYRILQQQGKDGRVIFRNQYAFDRAQDEGIQESLVFTCSMSDFFIEEADPWRSEAYDIIRDRVDLDWQILTKRPENIRDRLPEDWGDGYPHVWLGTSVENQDYAHRVVQLAEYKGDNLLFLSLEPLLGPIDFLSDPVLLEAFSKMDWVIIGGESGEDEGDYRYRKCEMDWIYNLIGQCDELGIPVFIKQLGTYLGRIYKNDDPHGGNQKQFPKALQRFEYPELD